MSTGTPILILLILVLALGFSDDRRGPFYGVGWYGGGGLGLLLVVIVLLILTRRLKGV